MNKKFDRIVILLIVAILIHWSANPFLGGSWLLDLTSHFRPAETLVLAALVGWVAMRKSWKLGVTWAVLAALGLAAMNQYDSWKNGGAFSWIQAGSVKRVVAPIQVITYNVWTPNPNKSESVSWIDSKLSKTSPNLVLLIETSRAWVEALAPLKEKLPYSLELARDDYFGLTLMSDLPLEQVSRVKLDQFGTPIYMGSVQLHGQRVRIAGLHPFAPIDAKSFQFRNEVYRNLRKALDEESVPTLVFGDLNTTPWSANFKSLLESRQGNPELALIDPMSGLFRSHTWRGFGGLLSFPIDYVLHTPHFSPKRVEVGPWMGSDHRPLLVAF